MGLFNSISISSDLFLISFIIFSSCVCVIVFCFCVYLFFSYVGGLQLLHLSVCVCLLFSCYGFLLVVVVVAVCFAPLTTSLDFVFALFCSSFVFVSLLLHQLQLRIEASFCVTTPVGCS